MSKYIPPDTFRYVSHVADKLGFKCEDLDNGGGYLFRVSNGSNSVLLGAGRLAPYPLNSGTAISIARDKIFTNRVLDGENISNLGGKCFFLCKEYSNVRREGLELSDARAYAQRLGFPLFCKPLNGSRGDFAEEIYSCEEFEKYISRVQAQRGKYDSFVVQNLFWGDEYRVFILDDEATFCLKKAECSVVGDGFRTLGELIEDLNGHAEEKHISKIPADKEIRTGSGGKLLRTAVLKCGETCSLRGRRNLSAGANIGKLVTEFPPLLIETAHRAVEALGLRLAGVDIMVDKLTSELRVIEVNGSPGIRTLELLDRWDLIEKIWGKVLCEALGGGGCLVR